MYGRMHLFISMLDSEEILVGSQSTVNLTFHSASYIYYPQPLSEIGPEEVTWEGFGVNIFYGVFVLH